MLSNMLRAMESQVASTQQSTTGTRSLNQPVTCSAQKTWTEPGDQMQEMDIHN